MASYKPNVRCNSFSGPPWRSCVSILSNMHADKYRQTFGHLPDGRVEVRLPFAYEAGEACYLLLCKFCSFGSEDGRCMVKIDITGQPTGLSWYEVWEATVALTATCVRGKQQSGKATGLGPYISEEVQAMGEANAPRSRP